MNEQIHAYVNGLFQPYAGAKGAAEFKAELLADLNERYGELRAQGQDELSALAETLDGIGDIAQALGEPDGPAQTSGRQPLTNFSAGALADGDFAGVALHGGKFHSSALARADFSGADLAGSVFTASDLPEADFSGANLTDCRFTSSNLRGANFQDAVLTRTRFCRSELSGVKFSHNRLLDVLFSGIDLRNTTFSACSIEGAAFVSSDLRGQSFQGLTLRNVRMGGAALEGASFRGALLQGVSFAPPFSLTGKYHRAIQTIRFGGACMDKLTCSALRSLGAELSDVIVR